MKRYLIERDIPKVGSLSREEYRGLAATLNAALAKLAGNVQWLRSDMLKRWFASIRALPGFR